MKLDSAQFEVMADPPVPEWPVRVTVQGEDFVDRAAPVAARVGDQPVEGIVTHPGGVGFTGFLRREPAEGDRLFVGYLDGDLMETTIEYRPPIV